MRVAADTCSGTDSARETVIAATPARLATSAIVGGLFDSLRRDTCRPFLDTD